MPNYTKMALVQKSVTYLLCNAFLRYGDYAQKMSMKPATITFPKVFVTQVRCGGKKCDGRTLKTEVML